MSKIIELRAQNFLNLKAVEIKADGKSVTLTGSNEAGKSAVLNAIFTALTGKPLEEPIRRGEDRAEVDVVLDHLVVRRVWTPKSGSAGSVVVESLPDKEGKSARYSSPQTLLNELLGRLSFNPIEFAQLGKTAEGRREQRRTLMEIAKLDLAALDTQRQAAVDLRASANRDVKRLEGALASMQKPEEGLPAVEVDLDDVLAKIKDLELRREGLHTYRFAKQQLENAGQRLRDEIAALEERLATLKGQLQKNVDEIANLGPEPVVPTAEEVAAAKEELTGLDAKNRKIRAAVLYREAAKNLEDAKAAAASNDAEVEKLDQEKRARIAGATYPIPGLSVDDECVLFNGLPLSQQSTGAQIRVSTAIAMALNPKLQVILVRDASLLDSDGLAEVTRMAEERGYQLFLERVDETGKIGVYIESGEVKAVDGVPVNQ